MKIATLGPKGTFSHEAVLKYDKKAKILFADTIRGVFELVREGSAQLGLVPAENSIAGSVGQTLDCLMEFDFGITGEMILPIGHNLVGFGDISDVKTLYAHPQTYEQCEIFIRKNFPKAEIIQTSSNGKSAEMLAKSKGLSNAGIISKIAAGIYKLKILKRDVQDNKFNATRFFFVGKAKTEKTGKDRTSIAVKPDYDKPGLLYSMLGEFAKRNINLTKIESRPSKGKLGEYMFYIDFEGHESENAVSEALKNISGLASVKLLGSYRRGY